MAKPSYGIQGGPGSFNEEALLAYTKKESGKLDAAYLYTSENVLTHLSAGNIDRGIIAIENAIGGVVYESIEALARHQVEIVDYINIRVVHALLMRPGQKAEEITKIISHPQALKQCKNTLERRYPDAKKEAGEGDAIDQATAAKLLADGEFVDTTAVLAARICAELYNLEIVDTNLQDKENNITTFLVLSQPSSTKLKF